MHLFPVGNPAGQAADGKHHREHVGGDTHGAVENAGIEVYVGVELAGDKVVVLQGGFFELERDFQQRVVDVFVLEHLAHELLQNFGTRVVTLVHPMAESRKAEGVVLVLGLFHHLFDGHAAVLDTEKRFQNGLVGAAVKRAPQGADAGADAGVKIRLGAAHHTHGRSGAVLLVVGVYNQQRVQRLFHDGVQVVGPGLAAEHHVQEVAAVAAFRFGVNEGFADACLVREGGDSADLGDKARGGQLESAGDVFVVVETGSEKANRVHDGTENAHGVGAGRHLTEKVQQVFVEQCVFGKQRAEMPQLLGVGQLAVNQEPCGFGEGGLFGQVLDGVAAVTENPLLAVHVGNGTLGAARVQVTVVQGHQAGTLAQSADVETVFVFGAFNHGEFVTLSVVIQGRFIGHDSSSRG